MTFDEAVAHVRATRVESVAAFAFVPTLDEHEAQIGGVIYIVAFVPDLTDDDDDPILVEFASGTFGIGEPEEDSFRLDDVPKNARALAYDLSSTYDRAIHSCNVETVLKVLRGAALDRALADEEESKRHEWKLTRSTEVEIGQLVLARGMPATMRTSAGLLPVVIVTLTNSDEQLETLLAIFGGLVYTSPETKRRVSPANRIALWVGIGRSAILATIMATRCLPLMSRDIGPNAADAWRALMEFAEAGMASPPDPKGRRPQAIEREMRRRATWIRRLLSRQMPEYGSLISTMGKTVTAKIDDGTLAADLRIPTAEEIDQPVRTPEPNRHMKMPIGKVQEVAIMPADELEEAVAAYQTIMSMTPRERERRVRREVGDPAFNAQYVFAGMPHVEYLFMMWCHDRWANQDRHVAAEWGYRAISAATWIQNLRINEVLPGRRLEAPGIDRVLLEALAKTRLTTALEPQSDRTAKAFPLQANVEWDTGQLAALLGVKRRKERRT